MILDVTRSADAIIAQLRRVAERFPDDPLPLHRLEAACESGEVQCFPVGESSVFLCQLFEDRAHILAAAGDMAELLEAEPHICEWYRQQGAPMITLRGRSGWRRVLGARGWRPSDYEGELAKSLLG